MRKVNYSPLDDREYLEGDTSDLSDWQADHIRNAVQAGLVVEIEKATQPASPSR